MGRINIRPPADLKTMTREECIAWAATVVAETKAAYEAEDEPDAGGQ